MSLRTLVTFAQNEISDGQMYEERNRHPPPPPVNLQPVQPLPEDSDSIAQRTPPPDWIRDPENDVMRVHTASSSIFTEGDFVTAIAPTGRLVVSPDTLAYYLPYHFYRN